jgi:hypothetical protein
VVVDGIEGRDTLYELELTAVPSPAWRAAFLRPPSHLTGPKSTPDVGRLYLQGATVCFRTAPRRLAGWLRRIDAGSPTPIQSWRSDRQRRDPQYARRNT